jgi:DNA-directed RNA polymerase subunit RPC12/RpoP
MKTAYSYPTYLKCPRCGHKTDEANAEVILVRGDGIITYICPKCGKVVESHRLE